MRSSSQQSPTICQMRSASAANRTCHVESVTCARYRWASGSQRVACAPPVGHDKSLVGRGGLRRYEPTLIHIQNKNALVHG